VTAPGEAAPIPFEGLRRNARALAAGALLIVLVFLVVPDLTPSSIPPPPLQLAHGRIVQLLPASDDPTQPDVRIELLDGPDKGKVVQGYLQGPSGQQDLPRYNVGDDIVVNISSQPDETTYIAVGDLYRAPVLGLLLGVFAVAVTVVGGWRGVRSLIALALTLAAVVKIVIPLILSGYEPVWVAIVAATAVTIATFLLTEGARRQTVAAAIGTFVSLSVVAILVVIFDTLARFTALRGSEDATYLSGIGLNGIDIGGLFLAAVIFGALGILDDVTVTQAATVQEIYASDPRIGRMALAGRAMNVGRSHIAATVNTLVLAYVGASLPLIVLFAAGRQDPLLTVSGETVAVEVVRALVGSIGIVAAVPVTTAIAVAMIGRRLPFVGEGTGVRHAPGWD